MSRLLSSVSDVFGLSLTFYRIAFNCFRAGSSCSQFRCIKRAAWDLPHSQQISFCLSRCDSNLRAVGERRSDKASLREFLRPSAPNPKGTVKQSLRRSCVFRLSGRIPSWRSSFFGAAFFLRAARCLNDSLFVFMPSSFSHVSCVGVRAVIKSTEMRYYLCAGRPGPSADV